MFTHRLKRLIAQTSIAALLFTQLAVAAYACPAPGSPAPTITAALSNDMHAAMPGCELRDAGNPNLCLQHCLAGDQSVQTLAQVPVADFAAISTIVVVAPVPLNADHSIAVLWTLPEHVTSPPPLIRFGVRRI